jgi:hypothetical protein
MEQSILKNVHAKDLGVTPNVSINTANASAIEARDAKIIFISP